MRNFTLIGAGSAAILLAAGLAMSVEPKTRGFTAGHKDKTRGVILSRNGNALKLRGDDDSIGTIDLTDPCRDRETSASDCMDYHRATYGLAVLPLTAQGERDARALAGWLAGLIFTKVSTSPLQRARMTCELAGFGPVAEIDNDLLQLNYGAYERLRR